jgi:hypothetical protein
LPAPPSLLPSFSSLFLFLWSITLPDELRSVLGPCGFI